MSSVLLPHVAPAAALPAPALPGRAPLAIPRRRETAAVSATAAAGRIQFIDVARGMLVPLMTSKHALTLAGVSAQSVLNSWWLPRGGPLFVIVAGYTLATVMPWLTDPARAARKTYRRAAELLLIMFVSNVVFLIGKACVFGGIDEMRHLNWWIGLITFQTAYTISQVLLPIATMLALVPTLFRLQRRTGIWVVAALALGATLVGGAWVFIGYGIIGFIIGQRWRHGLRKGGIWIPAAAVGLWALQHVSGSDGGLLATPIELAKVLLEFFIITQIALLVTDRQRQQFPGLESALGLWGRYALFCFLAHRLVMQGLGLVLRDRAAASLAPEAAYVVLLAGTMTALYLMCTLRTRWPVFDQGLRAIHV